MMGEGSGSRRKGAAISEKNIIRRLEKPCVTLKWDVSLQCRDTSHFNLNCQIKYKKGSESNIIIYRKRKGEGWAGGSNLLIFQMHVCSLCEAHTMNRNYYQLEDIWIFQSLKVKNLGSMPLAIAKWLLALVFEIWGPHFCGAFSGLVTIDLWWNCWKCWKGWGIWGWGEFYTMGEMGSGAHHFVSLILHSVNLYTIYSLIDTSCDWRVPF